MTSDDWILRLVRGRQELNREHGATEQRLLLIQAIAGAVAEKGFARISVEDVSARAGLGSEVFFDHFQDLESCFLAAYDLGVEVLSTTVQDGIGSPDRPPLERFERLLTTYLETLAAEPEFARTFLIEIWAAGPRAVQRRLEAWQRFTILLGEVLGPEEEGGLSPFLCEVLVGAISSLVTTRVAAGEFDRLPALREPITGLAERLLSPKPDEVQASPAGNQGISG